jgi:hypothetical protein
MHLKVFLVSNRRHSLNFSHFFDFKNVAHATILQLLNTCFKLAVGPIDTDISSKLYTHDYLANMEFYNHWQMREIFSFSTVCLNLWFTAQRPRYRKKTGPQFGIKRSSLHLQQDRGNWHHCWPIDDAAQNCQVPPLLRVWKEGLKTQRAHFLLSSWPSNMSDTATAQLLTKNIHKSECSTWTAVDKQ